MIPSDLYLLRGLKSTLSDLAGSDDAGTRDELLATLQRSLDELIGRQDRAHLASLHYRGAQLVSEAQATLGAPVVASAPDADLADVMRSLTRLMVTVAQLSPGGHDGFTAAVVEWEGAVATAPSIVGEERRSTLDLRPATLADYFRSVAPERRNLSIGQVRKLSGGFSKVTVIVELIGEQASEFVVIRAEQSGSPFLMDGSDVANEFRLLKYAYQRGLPVAEPLWLEADASKLGARFLVSRRAPGINHGDVYGTGASLSPAMVRELVTGLARIHATPIDRNDPLVTGSHLAKWTAFRGVVDFVPAYVDYWADLAQRCGIDHSPTLAWLFEWLRANAPTSEEPTVLIHGDYGLHNVMMEDGRITAVLDWENSHLGDPADEFFLFSFSMSRWVDRETLLSWYAEAGGRVITPYRLAYFDVMSCLRGLVVSYGSLTLPERSDCSNLKTCQIGFKHLAPHLGMLKPLIDRAESLREAADGPADFRREHQLQD